MGTSVLARVAAVVLNWHGREDTLRCVQSLYDQTYDNLSVLVVDNGSLDGTLQAVSESFPLADTLQLEVNTGYAGGNNAGIRYAREAGAELVFVVNSDVLCDKECVSALVNAVGPEVAAVAPTVVDADAAGAIQNAGGYYNVWTGMTRRVVRQPASSQAVDWVSGCAVLFTPTGLNRVGPFDESYFAYCEDLDWCLRANEAGLRVVHEPRAAVAHRPLSGTSELEQFLGGRNGMRVAASHGRGLSRVTSVAYVGIVDAGRRALATLKRGETGLCVAAIKGVLWHAHMFRRSNPLSKVQGISAGGSGLVRRAGRRSTA